MKHLFRFLLLVGALYSLPIEGIATDLSDNVPNKDSNITLDGMIGPYDPADSEGDPNFSNFDGELEGSIPDNYYTIAVDVPTNMYFTVAHGGDGNRGVFCSPDYTIKNKATRPIYVSLVTVDTTVYEENDEFSKLYLTTPTLKNGKIEIEVFLSMLNDTTSEKKSVMLSDSTPRSYLGILNLKETATLKFESTKWDAPGLDEDDDRHAKLDFKISLEFSLEDPAQSSQPDEQTDSEEQTDSPGSEEQIQP